MDEITRKAFARLVKALLHSGGLDINEAAGMADDFETEVSRLRAAGDPVPAQELQDLVDLLEPILKEF